MDSFLSLPSAVELPNLSLAPISLSQLPQHANVIWQVNVPKPAATNMNGRMTLLDKNSFLENAGVYGFWLVTGPFDICFNEC